MLFRIQVRDLMLKVRRRSGCLRIGRSLPVFVALSDLAFSMHYVVNHMLPPKTSVVRPLSLRFAT